MNMSEHEKENSANEESRFKRTIRSFVLRTGRMTAGQEKAFAEHWPQKGLQRENGMLNYAEVFGREAPVVLEIGFGMGASLVTMAKAAPEKDFIGIEVHRPGVEVMTVAEGFKNQYDGYAPRPDSRPLTKFEARGERLGHGVWDLLFEKVL